MSYKVYLDPGHGGSDPGAVDGKSGSDTLYSREKDLALAVSKLMIPSLIRCGLQVKASRSSDVYPSLTTRYASANSWGANVFVSIHFNSSTASTARGVEIIFPSGIGIRQTRSKYLADRVYKYVSACTPWADRSIYADRRGLAVLKGTKMPAILAEYGFISNSEEEKIIHTTAFRQCIAEGTVKGICEFLKVRYVPPVPIIAPKPTTTPAPTTSTASKSFFVTPTSLNVRSGPSNSYKIVKTLPKGTVVYVSSVANGWAKLTKNFAGYVAFRYLSNVKLASPATFKVLYVTTASLNVRSGPGASYKVIGTLKRYNAVQVESIHDGWAKLSSPRGYVAARYIG